jgi:signal transduction histidine kinase
MQNSMQAVRDASVTSIKDTSTTLQFVLVVAVILVIASGVALVLALQTTIVGPLTDLAAQVRRVARGSYGTAITVSGPPELQRLASDVNSMRQQIASDLAEVEAARHQIEQANVLLEQQAAELVRSNRDLEQFAYVASHDLQEPLRKVASFCQLLQRRYQGQLDERADQYIAFAVNGAQRMQRLITDLLAFSRIGRSTTDFADVDLNQVVANEVAELELGSDPDAPTVTSSELPVVRGEETLLATLFANLIGNAVKFRRPDAPARVQISAERDGVMWEISCVDNGIGIEASSRRKCSLSFNDCTREKRTQEPASVWPSRRRSSSTTAARSGSTPVTSVVPRSASPSPLQNPPSWVLHLWSRARTNHRMGRLTTCVPSEQRSPRYERAPHADRGPPGRGRSRRCAHDSGGLGGPQGS